MYSVTRNRETIYAEYIFNYHPEYKNQVDKYYDRFYPYHTEGGDLLNLNEHILAVGISQRTCPEAIDQLAKNLFKDPECKIDTVLAFNIPNSRAFMHLDTVFTQIDYDKFTYHPGIMDTLQVFEITEGDDPNSDEDLTVTEINDSLEHILEKYLKRKITLIPCAGGDKVSAEREQWNDGSNTLCIAPGVVIVYDRNKKELLECIDRATLLVKEGDKKPIIINITDAMMELKINSTVGSMNEEIDISKQGKDIMIGFNPKFMIDALRVIDDEQVDIYLVNPKAPCFIRDVAEKYIYLILPVNFTTVS